MRVVGYLSRVTLASLVVWSLASAAPELLGVQVAFANETAIPGLALGASQSATASSPIMSTSARMIGGLFLCLGVFALIVRLLKRHASRTGTGRRRLEIRERIALSSKASLTLVAIDNREFLVASGSESVSMLPTRVVPPGLFDESLGEVVDEAEAFNA